MLVRTCSSGSSELHDQAALTERAQRTLDRFILLAGGSVRRRGLHLTIEDDFGALLAVNAANRADWHPLAPSFDPRHGAVNAGNAFWIRGRNESGDTVLTHAIRHYQMIETTLAAELESLRLLYGDPQRQARPHEICRVSVAAAQQIRGSVVYSGGTWLRPDFRGRGLASIVPRLARSIALARWNTDFAFSLVERPLVEKGLARRYGFRLVEYGVDWRNSSAADHIEFALVWIGRDDFLFDLETALVLR